MRNQFNTISEVWEAINQGKTVYWSNKAYKLTIEDNNAFPAEFVARMGWDKHFTMQDNKLLRVTCISNWFGSLLTENELSKLFTAE